MLPKFAAASYFQEISDNLSSWQLNEAAIAVLAVIFSLLLLVFCAYTLSSIFKRRSSAFGKPVFQVSRREEMRSLFETALEDRSKFELNFDPKSKFLAICSLESIQPDGLVLEPPSNINPKQSWVGRTVYIYFSIPLEKKQRIFYFFTSSINDIIRYNPQRAFLQIAMPEKVLQRSKRNLYRIDPRPDSIRSLVAWPAAYRSTGHLVSNIHQLGEPLFERGSIDQNRAVELANISGGGVRLKISNKCRKHTQFSPDETREIILYLSLFGHDDNLPINFYLFCRIRNVYQDFNTYDLEVGLQFMSVGRPQPEQPSELTWTAVDAVQGVDDIATWVMKEHLKLYREKGIT